MNDYSKFIRWLVLLAMPIFLGFNIVSLIIGETYPRYQYNNPNFPADLYGFTNQERLELALVAVHYLERTEPAEEVIYLLEEQRIPGTDRPLYNEREIGHMVDVKKLTDLIRMVGRAAAVIVVGGLFTLLTTPATRPEAYRAIWQGGLATTGLLMALALFIVVGWNVFFVWFHELLFPPGTWSFSYSDSLIRLFPEKFWFDLGVLLSGGTLFAGLLVAATGFFLLRRSS